MPKTEDSMVTAVILGCSFQKWKCHFQHGLQEEQIFRGGGRGEGGKTQGGEGVEEWEILEVHFLTYSA